MNSIDWDSILNYKNSRIVEIIMERRHMTFADASRIWYNSRTKKETLDSTEFRFVSVARCYEELERELAGDPFWMVNPFE